MSRRLRPERGFRFAVIALMAFLASAVFVVSPARAVTTTVVSLTFDDAAWAGAGASVFGAVLAVALAEYLPINQFAETVVRTTGQGEVMRYAARAGRCEML